MSEHGSTTAKQAGHPNIFGTDDSPPHFPHGHVVGKASVGLSQKTLSQSIVHWFLHDLLTLGGASVD